MADVLYAVLSLLGFVLVPIPLPWNLHPWSSKICLFIVWTAIRCLVHFMNVLVWADSVDTHWAPWCDISTKLIVRLSVALPAASLCINRRLFAIATVSQVYSSKTEKRRAIYVDLAIGVGLPVLHPPGHPLVFMWPILIGVISFLYAALTLVTFMRRRRKFASLMANNPTLNMHRYFRLMALVTVEICITTPVSIHFMFFNLTTTQVTPWVSWSDTKWGFSRLNFELNIWLFPASAFIFFPFFGFVEEAQRPIKSVLISCVNLSVISVKASPSLPPSPSAHSISATLVQKEEPLQSHDTLVLPNDRKSDEKHIPS
ncbi:hypothetical protein M422DRAFT_62265 [Sphaerobolus stellatus SS14]|uniref:Pheromone receptor n=1 Tax=Sphaerobolus stellatus (strain SS14) TaxID=990650 RepID=A0A0C9UJ94_SPHS4|nr:hypothetical protein M422DRAFT_62265 [Sphaerobolus stellatus SS14]